MNSYRNLLLILIISSVWHSVAIAQKTETSIDLRLLEILEKELSPDASQLELLDSIVRKAAIEVEQFEAEKLKAQRETEDEELLLTQLKVLNQQIKDVRDMRDLDIKGQLNNEQLLIYNEKIKPSKPQILHFGLHNRADCKVCTK